MRRLPLILDGKAEIPLGHVVLNSPHVTSNMNEYADQMVIFPVYRKTPYGNEIIAFSVANPAR